MYRFAVIIEQAPDGGFGAYAPDLPGCVGMGATRNETMENMIEAIRFHIEGMIEEGLPIPVATSEAENLVIALN